MSLSPSATFTLGNLRYDPHAVEIVVSLGLLPAVNSARITIPAGVDISASAGDPAELTLDGGEGAQIVLTGKVRTLRRRVLVTEVTLSDSGADLARLRPAATYERQNARNVVRALAGDAGADTGSLDLDLPLAAYVAHQGRTAAEHVAYLSALAGTLACVNAEGQLEIAAWPEGQPEAALKFGRELLSYEVNDDQGAAAAPVVIGAGPAGSAEAPDALRHSLNGLPEDAPKPGTTAWWRSAAVLRTPGAADTATRAAQTRAAAEAQRARSQCFLLPTLRPGQVIEVQETPDGLSGGPWLLTRVRHTLTPMGGGQTVWEGLSAGASGGLLGSLISAMGSLL